MNRQKIVEIIPQLNSGGAERFVVDLCNELVECHEVTLIVLFPLETHGFYSKELDKKIKVLSLNKKLGKDLTLPFRLHIILKRERPQIVHTHLNAFYYSLFSILFARNKKMKFFHTIHNDAFEEAPGKYGVRVKKALLRLNSFQPVTISQSSKNSFLNVYKRNSILILNGRSFEYKKDLNSETEKFFKRIRGGNDNKKILVNVARISAQKNQLSLVRNVMKLNQEGFNVELLIIGSHLDKVITKQINEIKDSKIHLLGEKENVIDYLKLSDAFCLSSLHEGLPISLIEALSVGLIPVCTPAGGIYDLIDHDEDGILANGFSESSYFDALLKFLKLTNEEADIRKMNCMRKSKSLSIRNCASNYLRHFKI